MAGKPNSKQLSLQDGVMISNDDGPRSLIGNPESFALRMNTSRARQPLPLAAASSSLFSTVSITRFKSEGTPQYCSLTCTSPT
ncbi:hypothetical protein DAI22_04g081000 [Oryza sativa Japonica Group]|nr:hypothetical protein DAI22_04g081000 [Oryza sativa Japonica Group]